MQLNRPNQALFIVGLPWFQPFMVCGSLLETPHQAVTVSYTGYNRTLFIIGELPLTGKRIVPL